MGEETILKIIFFGLVLIAVIICTIVKMIIIYSLCVKSGKMPCVKSKIEIDVKNVKASKEIAVTYTNTEKMDKEKSQR